MTLSLSFLGVACGIHMCSKENFHQGRNLINVVYLSSVLSAKSAQSSGSLLLRATVFLCLLQQGGCSQPEGENAWDRAASILEFTQGMFLYPLGTFGSVASPPSSHGGLLLIAAEPIHNFHSRGQDGRSANSHVKRFTVCDCRVCEGYPKSNDAVTVSTY